MAKIQHKVALGPFVSYVAWGDLGFSFFKTRVARKLGLSWHALKHTLNEMPSYTFSLVGDPDDFGILPDFNRKGALFTTTLLLLQARPTELTGVCAEVFRQE